MLPKAKPRVTWVWSVRALPVVEDTEPGEVTEGESENDQDLGPGSRWVQFWSARAAAGSAYWAAKTTFPARGAGSRPEAWAGGCESHALTRSVSPATGLAQVGGVKRAGSQSAR